MDSLYIVMPAYNEEENIEAVVRAWYPLLEGKAESSRLVVADSGSSDGTHAILVRLRRELPKLELLEGTKRQHGPKLIALYRLAASRGADYIFQTDSDGQTDPSGFGAFWRLRKKYDVILGNRRDRGDGRSRAFVEQTVCFLLRLYFGVKVPDANAPFRLMKTGVVEKYLDCLEEDQSIPNIMLTALFASSHEKLAFYEIAFRPRQGGKSSLNIPAILKIGGGALGDFSRLKTRRKA